YDNVIDGAGSGFVIGGSTTVTGNTIDHNIILNSTGLPNAGLTQGVGIKSVGPLGHSNAFTDNDVDGSIGQATGIEMHGNTTAAPKLADPADHDYRLTTSTPPTVTAWGLWDGAPSAA
ncbi:MAG TPA: hypothetical protein VMF14_05700, partial [Solirubrobacteraceae bacterium]|nr:hypothetical protein [Solirubrobacteraceae bacterium]